MCHFLALIYTSPIMNDEYLFMFLLIICMSPSEKCLSKSFAHFETRLWDFLDMYTPLCLFICLLCWVFVAVHGLSLLSERGLLSSCDAQASHVGLLLWWSTGSMCAGFSSCGTRA